MTQLFDRVSRVTLNSRVIESSSAAPQAGIIKLDVDVTHTAVMRGFPVATVVIWNPSDETIGECQSTRDSNDETVFPSIKIEMGYVGGTDIVMNGLVAAFKVDKKTTDRALTITASEQDAFKPVVSKKSFVDKRASFLLSTLASGFINKLDLGEDVLVPKLVVRNVLTAIQQVVVLSKSTFYFSAGKINIIPETLVPSSPTVVDENSGLLEKPEKIESKDKKEKGYLIRTLPLAGVRAGSSIKALYNGGFSWVEGVVYDSKISLPSRGEALAEYKVAA